MSLKRTLVALVAAASQVSSWAAQPPEGPVRMAELVDLDLEQLTRISVTSASRREERLLDTAASIFVITAEDIRRSGATSLPEALRLAPNLQVVRADANQYVISARGGLTSTANKMLVLVDGRTIYTPLFSGVFWEAQDVMLEDVDRIEVISGPGSTLWGTNAVNGLISITTKSASKTRGALVTAAAGGDERGIAARAGATLGDRADYRIYAKAWNRDALATSATGDDSSQRRQAGFRADWATGGQSATLQGDYYRADVNTVIERRNLSGGNLLGRWGAALDAADVSGRMYADHTSREHVGVLKEARNTFEVEGQADFRRRGDHRLILGASYRASRDHTFTRPALTFLPESETLTNAALFAQDEWMISPSLRAQLGARLEHNNYTGLEWLPDARLAWAPKPDHLVWASVSRTVRAPARIDRDAATPGTPPYVLGPSPAFDSETADVAQLGYRARVADRTTLSLTAFHHRLHGLRVIEPGPSGPLVFANGADTTVRGVEGWLESLVTPEWRLTAGFTSMSEDTTLLAGHANLGAAPNGDNPARTYSLRSLWNVTPRHDVDITWRHVSALPNPVVPAYASLDVRLGWRVSRNLEISTVVQNALDRKHAEYGGSALRSEFGRAWLVEATFSPW